MTEKFHVRVFDHVGVDGRVILLKGDEGGGGDGQLLEVILHHFVNLGLLLAHGVEVVGSDGSTTVAEGQNKVRVVEGEDDVGNGGLNVLVLLVFLAGALFLALSVEFLLGPLVVSDPRSEFILNFFLELLLEGDSRGHAIIEGATRPPVHILLPIFVGLFLDGEFDGVVTSSHSRAVPLDPLDGTTLVHEADGGGKKEGDEDGGTNSKRHLAVLQLLVSSALDARVLHEQGRFGGDTGFSLCSRAVELALLADEIKEEFLLVDGSFEAFVGENSVGRAGVVIHIRHAVVAVLGIGAHTVVVDLANDAIWASK